MKLIVARDHAEMSAIATDIVASLVATRPDAALGLTTGNTPVELYTNLSARQQAGELCLEQVRVFCTEEYLGVGPDVPHGLFAWLERVFLLPCALTPAQVCRLRGEDPEPQLACQQFDALIQSVGGLDLVVESIGLNGHIGFNEPGSPLDAPTRIVALTDRTLEYNVNYWNREVPRYGMTIGMGTILAAKQILVLVSGLAKAETLARVLTGPITLDLPASVLQRTAQAIIVADQEAASLLPESLVSASSEMEAQRGA